jgi:hypothetical protein
MDEASRLNIYGQASRIEDECEHAAVRDALLSSRWRRVNVWLGLSAAITAALAAFLVGGGGDLLDIVKKLPAVAALGEVAESLDSLVAALFALSSAVLASTLTFLTPSERAGTFQQYSNKYHALRESTRFFTNNRCVASADPQQLEIEFQQILQAKKEIDAEHPVTPAWADRKAHRKIKQKIIRNQKMVELRQREKPRESAVRVPGRE